MYHRASFVSSDSPVRLTRYPERRQISQIFPVDITPAEHVDDIVDDSCGMAFPWDWDVADAGELRPLARFWVKAPGVVVVEVAVRPAEHIQHILPAKEDMASSR
jgi:hypothetical protein